MATITNPGNEVIFAGEVSKVRRTGTLVSGQNLAKNTVLMTNALGKYLAHDGAYANKVAGVLISAVDASAADKPCMVYKDGDFVLSKLAFPTNINSVAATTLSKQKLLEGSQIYATPYGAGE